MIIIHDNDPSGFFKSEYTITKIDFNPDFVILTCLNSHDLESTIKIERYDFITICKCFCDQPHL